MKQYKSRVPKKRKNEGIEAAVNFIFAPVNIALKLGKKKKRKRKKK